MAAPANGRLDTCPVKCRGLILQKTCVNDRQWSTRVDTYCRESSGSEVVGSVNSILAIVYVSSTVGINLVGGTSL
jgi:hypothetical protein